MSQRQVSGIPVGGRPYQGLPAGIVTRATAAVVDAVVVIAILVGGYLVFAAVRFLIRPRTFTLPSTNVVVSLTTALVVAMCYLAASWWVTGRTFGDRVFGLRVVSVSGRRVNPVVALARAVLCVLFPIGLFWCAVSRSQRSVQDLLMRTTVRYDWRATALWNDPPLAPVAE